MCSCNIVPTAQPTSSLLTSASHSSGMNSYFPSPSHGGVSAVTFCEHFTASLTTHPQPSPLASTVSSMLSSSSSLTGDSHVHYPIINGTHRLCIRDVSPWFIAMVLTSAVAGNGNASLGSSNGTSSHSSLPPLGKDPLDTCIQTKDTAKPSHPLICAAPPSELVVGPTVRFHLWMRPVTNPSYQSILSPTSMNKTLGSLDPFEGFYINSTCQPHQDDSQRSRLEERQQETTRATSTIDQQAPSIECCSHCGQPMMGGINTIVQLERKVKEMDLALTASQAQNALLMRRSIDAEEAYISMKRSSKESFAGMEKALLDASNRALEMQSAWNEEKHRLNEQLSFQSERIGRQQRMIESLQRKLDFQSSASNQAEIVPLAQSIDENNRIARLEAEIAKLKMREEKYKIITQRYKALIQSDSGNTTTPGDANIAHTNSETSSKLSK